MADCAPVSVKKLARAFESGVFAVYNRILRCREPYITRVQINRDIIPFHRTPEHHEHRLHGHITYPAVHEIMKKIEALGAVFNFQVNTRLKSENKPNSQREFSEVLINDLRSLI